MESTADKRVGGPMPIHVVPTKDILEHKLTIHCWCKPQRDNDDGTVIVHNAFAEEYGNERNLE